MLLNMPASLLLLVLFWKAIVTAKCRLELPQELRFSIDKPHIPACRACRHRNKKSGSISNAIAPAAPENVMDIASTCRHRERRRHRKPCRSTQRHRHRHSKHCRTRESHRHRYRTQTASRAIAIGNTWRSRENTRLAKRLSLLQSGFGREDKPRTRQLGLQE
jgi:hypothetical protein